MLKLIKNMRRKEKEMALLCLVFVVVQIYFDLRLPDYMTELTMLIKTSGTTADIAAVGLKMLGCTAASAVLAIACGFLAAKTASGFVTFSSRQNVSTSPILLPSTRDTLAIVAMRSPSGCFSSEKV